MREPQSVFDHGDQIVMRCATCGKPKPNDAAWARSATCCGESKWTATVAVSETPEEPVVTGDVKYGWSL